MIQLPATDDMRRQPDHWRGISGLTTALRESVSRSRVYAAAFTGCVPRANQAFAGTSTVRVMSVQHACKIGPEGIVSKRWDRVTAQGDRRLAEVQDSGSAGGEARGGSGLGSLTITTRERRGLR
jgi:hypothetical protein